MGILFDPLDPPNQKQKLGVVLYAVLALVSIWATGESLAMHFDFSKWIAYILGLVIVLVMAATMTILKDSVSERKILPALISLVVFLLVWTISLTTNTHNFYLKGSLKDIQERELKAAKKELEGLQVKSYAIVDDMAANCRSHISKLAENYYQEVVNPNNDGHGPLADSLKTLVEKSMPGSAFRVLSRTPLSTKKDKRNFAAKMKQEMMQELDNRLNSMLSRKDEISQLVDTEDFSSITNEINENLLFFYDSDIKTNRSLISQSYALHNGLVDKVDKLLFSGMLDCQGSKDELGNLPETPGSIELENISNTYSYVNRTGGFSTSEFLFAFLLALGIDLGAFVIFYLMILKKRD